MLAASSSPYIAAGAAVLGSLVGGAVTGFVTLRAESKRQAHALRLEADRRREKSAAERRAGLVAARVIVAELMAISARLDTDGPVPVMGDLPSAAWNAHREQLAYVTPTIAWLNVATAYSEVEVARRYLAAARDKGEEYIAKAGAVSLTIEDVKKSTELLIELLQGSRAPSPVPESPKHDAG